MGWAGSSISVYGLHVLVIREVAIRGRLGLVGLWSLGLVYGLYNEGLRSQTLFFPHHAPIEEFSTYGLVGHLRIPFTLFIIAWHALFSVVTPILLVEYLFPGKARQPWLPRNATWAVAILRVVTAVHRQYSVGPGGVVFAAVFITMLVAIRRKDRRSLTAEPCTPDVQ